MTALPPLRPILNDTPASAIDVDWNFQTIEDYNATDLIKRDGSVAMEAPLNLLGPAPTLATHAITKGYVDSQIIPIGTIWQFAGSAAPSAWAFCDGSEKSSTDPAWTALFAVIGYSYGQNGTNFRLPDMRGRMPVGRQAGDGLFGNLGQSGGSRDLIIPNHVHGMKNHWHGMKGHIHNMSGHRHYVDHAHSLSGHQHLNTARAGYDINHANQPGTTNAIFPATGNTPLSFSTRRTAIMQSQEAGSATDWTGGPNIDNTGNANRQYTDGPDDNRTTGPNDDATGYPNDNNTDNPTGGVSPANANLQPYVTVNFIIRIG